MSDGDIDIEDARAPDVRRLLECHLEFCRAHTRPEDVHALEVEGLVDPSITVFSYRSHGEVLGVAALKQLDVAHGEVKAMHTAQAARGRGIGAALLDHLIEVARGRGYERLSLETGSQPAFRHARALYTRAGFRVCQQFGSYTSSSHSTFMTLALPSNGQRQDHSD